MSDQYIIVIGSIVCAAMASLYYCVRELGKMGTAGRGTWRRQKLSTVAAASRIIILFGMGTSFIFTTSPASFCGTIALVWLFCELEGRESRKRQEEKELTPEPELKDNKPKKKRSERLERKFREKGHGEIELDEHTTILQSLEILDREPETPEECFKWGQGYALGIGVPQDDARALRYYQQGSDLGEYRCKLRLGKSHLNGRDGAEKDPAKAFQYFKEFSEVELDTRANLAWDILYYPLCLFFGIGCPVDKAAAGEFLRLARSKHFSVAKDLAQTGTSSTFSFLSLDFEDLKKVRPDEFMALFVEEKAQPQQVKVQEIMQEGFSEPVDITPAAPPAEATEEQKQV